MKKVLILTSFFFSIFFVGNKTEVWTSDEGNLLGGMFMACAFLSSFSHFCSRSAREVILHLLKQRCLGYILIETFLCSSQQLSLMTEWLALLVPSPCEQRLAWLKLLDATQL